MAAYDHDASPADFPTLKAVLIERLEAAATGAQKALKGGLSQQSVDNWAACVDMDNALGEIAKQCVLASIEIERVMEEYRMWCKSGGAWIEVPVDIDFQHEGEDEPDTSLGEDGEYYRQNLGIKNAKVAFDLGVKRINAVTAANTPVWHIAGTNYPAFPPAPVAVEGNDVLIIAKHPDGLTVEGGVSMPQSKFQIATPYSITPITPGDPSLQNAAVTKITPNGASPGDVVKIRAESRNLCGNSVIHIELTIPTP